MKSDFFVESFDSKGEVRLKKSNLNMNIVVTSRRSKIYNTFTYMIYIGWHILLSEVVQLNSSVICAMQFVQYDTLDNLICALFVYI